MMKTKIFCSTQGKEPFIRVFALSESGEFLTGHLSSNETW